MLCFAHIYSEARDAKTKATATLLPPPTISMR